MDCNEMFYLMNLELDGEISAQEQQLLDHHRATCPHCATLSEELRQMQLAVQNLDDVEVPEGFKHRVLEQITRESATPKVVPFRQKVVRYGMLAACAALCVGLYQSGIFQVSSDGMSASTSSASMAVATTTETDIAIPESAVENRAVAEIDAEESLESTVTTTTTTTVAVEDVQGGQTLPEQVAALLGVEETAWVMIDRHDIPDEWPLGIEELVEMESFAYFIVDPAYWEDVRLFFGFGASIEAVEDGVPCVVIVMSE